MIWIFCMNKVRKSGDNLEESKNFQIFLKK